MLKKFCVCISMSSTWSQSGEDFFQQFKPQDDIMYEASHIRKKKETTGFRDTIRYDTIRYDTIRYDTIRFLSFNVPHLLLVQFPMMFFHKFIWVPANSEAVEIWTYIWSVKFCVGSQIGVAASSSLTFLLYLSLKILWVWKEALFIYQLLIVFP